MKRILVVGIATAFALAACSEGTSPSKSNKDKMISKSRIRAAADAVIGQGTNGFYTVFVTDVAGPGIGQYTVMTGPQHPVTISTGSPKNVIFGNGNPGTSYNTVHSFTTNTDYVNASTAPSLPGIFVLDPTHAGVTATVTPLGLTGFRTTYVLSGPPNTPDALTIVEDVNTHGSTFETSTVEVTTKVTNNGAANASIGIRYLWDMNIGDDDGPTFQQLSPDAAVLHTEQTFTSPSFGFFRIQDNDENDPTPLFSVFGTVTQPSTITPVPVPPDLLQNVSWPDAVDAPFAYTTTGANVSDAPGINDNAVLYFWGHNAASAIVLTPGASRTVSQSLVSAEANAPPPFNQNPVAKITAPANNASFAQGASVSFAGTGTDPEDGTLTGGSLVWTDGSTQIGTGLSFSTSTLSVGTHIITLTVTDSKGATGTATVTVVITGTTVNQPPTAAITSPGANAVFAPGSAVSFAGTGHDPEDGTLTGASLVWTEGSTQIGTGTSFSLATLSGGPHTITLTATDSKGAHGTATVSFTMAFNQSIGSAGGSLCVESCHLSLFFPQGALTSTTTFFVWTTPAPTPVPGIVGGTAYVIAPAVNFGVIGELGIGYDPATLPAGVSESSLRLYQYFGGSWHLIPNGGINTTSHIVFAPVNSTGIFAIVGGA